MIKTCKLDFKFLNTYKNINVIKTLKTFRYIKSSKAYKMNIPTRPESVFDKKKIDYLLKQRFFIEQSFAIYGGLSGMYDLGPMGCAVKNNILKEWRNQFIYSCTNVYEIDTPTITYDKVFKASGHTAKFIDYKVKDLKTGDCFRLDHIIADTLKVLIEKCKDAKIVEKMEIILSQLDGYSVEEMENVLKEYKVKSPLGNDLSDAVEFNLMFSTKIGASGTVNGFLRPETAQGMFLNFLNLLKFNDNKLPFAAVQIGKSYRNEISPRGGLIRCREFLMAEIEYFYDTDDGGRHVEYDGNVGKTQVLLYSVESQMKNKSAVKMTIEEALENKVIKKQNLAYYMAKIQFFLESIGLNPEWIRFRQHLPNEMAHYACDCWDAECLMSAGWIECVGCADRSCYDLQQHTKFSGVDLVANKKLAEPIVQYMESLVISKSKIAKIHKKATNLIFHHLENLPLDQQKRLSIDIDENGSSCIFIDSESYSITKDMMSLQKEKKSIHVEQIIPHVIEPSFGIGRIMLALFEHSFRVREIDTNRCFLSLSLKSAPYKCSVIPLSRHEEILPFAKLISNQLQQQHVAHKVENTSSSIGKMYARTDEIGIPYAVTVDFDTARIKPATVSLRERDSMKQIRIPIDDVSNVINRLMKKGENEWENVKDDFDVFEHQLNKI